MARSSAVNLSDIDLSNYCVVYSQIPFDEIPFIVLNINNDLSYESLKY